ncbi:MAG: alpha/beta hydrolase [Kurthia sp.]|nr:alpha/beta hydrolase [Candidatus Kurthia equi]
MLAYTKSGTGTPIVFIHGFLSGGRSFDAIVDDLAATHTVIVVDLPGIGKSEMEQKEYSIVDYAKEINNVLLYEEIEEAVWVGHSMGGYIALAAADEKIAQVKQLILLFSSDLADAKEAIEKRENQKRQLEKDGVAPFVDSLIENFFPEGTPTEPIDFMREVAKDATIEGMVQQLSAMQGRKERSEYIEKATIPLTIIEGTNDKIVPPIETDGPNVQRVKVSTGHFGMAEKPDLVIDAIRMVLEK